MLAQKTTPLIVHPTEEAAVRSLVAEPEAPLSDAPLPAPESKGLLLLGLLLSPKTPTEPKGK
ncbi:hypothetical protein IHE55_11425 [Streptomyces pactum]|uniref:Uncharacterized protein n=1 Tax=Streptomyces pactum TaxID=68249 RepID=A0ABS0NJS7_9ACTN|nr:hypothetical protein [Streptomyces pactum]MBH5335372.1 hypothetical protein [Streptomyces pactum]